MSSAVTDGHVEVSEEEGVDGGSHHSSWAQIQGPTARSGMDDVAEAVAIAAVTVIVVALTVAASFRNTWAGGGHCEDCKSLRYVVDGPTLG